MMRHTNSTVLALALTLDGRWIASGSRDHTARIWDAQLGEAVTPPLQHLDFVRTLALSPDGRRLVTSSFGRRIWFWEVFSGWAKPVFVDFLTGVYSMAFSHSGTLLALGDFDGQIHVIESATGKPRFPPPSQDGWVDTIQFSPDDQHMVTRKSLGAKV